MIYNNDDGPKHIRSLLYLSVFVLFVGYQIINVFVPNADMILAARVLAVGFYVGVMYIYGADAIRALMDNHPKRSDFLVVGIWLSFMAHLLQCVYSIIYRLAPSEWLLYSEVVSPIIMLSVVAATLHVSAPGAVDGVVPRRNKIALGVSVGIAAFIVASIMVSKPDLRPYIQDLKPYISDFWGTDRDNPDTPPNNKTPWRHSWQPGQYSRGFPLAAP